MGVKRYKPTSPGRRFQTVSDFAEVTRAKPEKSLVEPLTKKGGRNNKGRISVRHQGGGHKRRYRKIDFKRKKDGVPAKVAAIEYDPNRSSRIALLHYADGEKRYILAPQKLSVGDKVESGPDADIKPGNALPLENIPTGTVVHAVELQPGRGAAIARSAGTSVQLMAKEGYEGDPEDAFVRDADGAALRAAPPSVSSATSSTRVSRSARRAATAGRASAPPSAVPHEPGRPPARRRRGQEQDRRSSPRDAVGQAHSGHRTRKKHKYSDRV